MAFGSKDKRYLELENLSSEVSLVDLRNGEYCENMPPYPEEVKSGTTDIVKFLVVHSFRKFTISELFCLYAT